MDCESLDALAKGSKVCVSVWTRETIGTLSRKDTLKLEGMVHTFGKCSAAAQGLTSPVTDLGRLQANNHVLYLAAIANGGAGFRVLGGLKVGKKRLYMYHGAALQEITPDCVLDFYVHESCQRLGVGRLLLDTFLVDAKKHAAELAYDRPSQKLISFMRKHYGLHAFTQQSNNYVIYHHYFEMQKGASSAVGRQPSDSSPSSAAAPAPAVPVSSTPEPRASPLLSSPVIAQAVVAARPRAVENAQKTSPAYHAAGVRTEVACRASNSRGSQTQMEIGSPSRESLVGPGTLSSVVPAKQRSDGRRIKDPPPMHAAGKPSTCWTPESRAAALMHSPPSRALASTLNDGLLSSRASAPDSHKLPGKSLSAGGVIGVPVRGSSPFLPSSSPTERRSAEVIEAPGVEQVTHQAAGLRPPQMQRSVSLFGKSPQSGPPSIDASPVLPHTQQQSPSRRSSRGGDTIAVSPYGRMQPAAQAARMGLRQMPAGSSHAPTPWASHTSPGGGKSSAMSRASSAPSGPARSSGGVRA